MQVATTSPGQRAEIANRRDRVCRNALRQPPRLHISRILYSIRHRCLTTTEIAILRASYFWFSDLSDAALAIRSRISDDGWNYVEYVVTGTVARLISHFGFRINNSFFYPFVIFPLYSSEIREKTSKVQYSFKIVNDKSGL